MMKCAKFLDIVILLFIEYIDKEIVYNCLDILTSLAKHIVLKESNYGKEMVQTLFKLIKTTNSEATLDQWMECLRKLCLSTGNDECIEDVTIEDDQFDKHANFDLSYCSSNLKTICQCLLSKNMETREAALEILWCISDRKIETKVRIANQKNWISRIVALIAAGSHTPGEERVSKLAALTLSNINLEAKNKKLIMPYESELALIAASDENVSKIIADILGDLDTYQVNDNKIGGSGNKISA